MENRNEFNLENNIKQWKLNLTSKNNLTKANIIELENHLLESVNDLKSKGLNEEESFIIARKRIGKIDDICLEFDKVNINFSIINKIVPYLKGALIYVAFTVLSKLFLITFLHIADRLSINSSTFNIISILLLVFVLALFFSFIYFNIKKRKSFLKKLNEINVLVLLIVLSQVIMFFIAQLPLRGIDPSSSLSEIGNLKIYGIMTYNFALYKIVFGFLLLTISLIIFWNNKNHNKLKFVK